MKVRKTFSTYTRMDWIFYTFRVIFVFGLIGIWFVVLVSALVFHHWENSSNLHAYFTIAVGFLSGAIPSLWVVHDNRCSLYGSAASKDSLRRETPVIYVEVSKPHTESPSPCDPSSLVVEVVEYETLGVSLAEMEEWIRLPSYQKSTPQ
jgi:hypothetical protein